MFEFLFSLAFYWTCFDSTMSSVHRVHVVYLIFAFVFNTISIKYVIHRYWAFILELLVYYWSYWAICSAYFIILVYLWTSWLTLMSFDWLMRVIIEFQGTQIKIIVVSYRLQLRPLRTTIFFLFCLMTIYWLLFFMFQEWYSPIRDSHALPSPLPSCITPALSPK